MLSFTPVRKRRRYQEVAQQIQLAILNGDYQDGDRLPPERDLAERYAVSRTVVREAMKVLEAQGLVTIERGSGVFVRAPDTKMVVRQLAVYFHMQGEQEAPFYLHEVRRHLESGIVELAAERRTGEDLQQLNALLEQMRDPSLAAEAIALVDLDFHLALARATQNPIFPLMLSPLISLLRDQFLVTWRGYDEWPPRRVLEQHTAILEAVVAGDPQRARQTLFEHLDSSEETLRRLHVEKDGTGPA